MAFKGVLESPEITPAPFGLFSVSVPNDPAESDNEQWVRGFSQMLDTRPNYVRLWDDTSATSFVATSDPASPIYQENTPIFIEVEDFRSTFDLPTADKFSRIAKQLEGVTQKGLEKELWDGEIALAGGLPNPFLSKQTATIIHVTATPSASYSPKRAIALLDYHAGRVSAAGEPGVFHLTRDTFSLLISNGHTFAFYPNSEAPHHVLTLSGTSVIVGSGYSGNGPHRNISFLAVTTNVVTVTTGAAHHLSVGETFSMVVTSGNAGYQTAFTQTLVVASIPTTTTFTAALTQANQGDTASTGTVQMVGTDTTKWIYATGCVKTIVGDSVIVNDTVAHGYDVAGNKNDVRIKATRAAMASFDESIHLAIKVDLTA